MADFNKSAACGNYIIQRKNDFDISANEGGLGDQSSQGSRKELTIESSKLFRQNLIKNGFNIIRVPTGQKSPRDKNWTEGSSSNQLLNPSNEYLNTGLLCSGLRVIDVDVEDEKLAHKIEEIAQRIIGSLGPKRYRDNSNKFAIVYRAKSGKPKKRLNGNRKVEVLGDGQQLIVDGLHPSDFPYVWPNDRSLENTSRDDIPVVTEEQISKFLEACDMILGCSNGDNNERNLVNNNDIFAEVESEFISQENEHYFHRLSNKDKDELLLACLRTIPDIADASYPEWIKVIMACHASGAPNAMETARNWSKLSDKYDFNDYEKKWASLCRDKTQGITIGTLIKMARERGLDTRNYWTKAKNAEAKSIIPIPQSAISPLAPIEGGYYSPEEGMRKMNERYSLVNENGQVTIFKKATEGSLERTDEKSLKISLANTYVLHPSDNKKSIPLYTFWLKNPNRPAEKSAVFKIQDNVGPNEYNFYRGFGVTRQIGRDKIRKILSHVWKIICKKDKQKFKYLIKWLSWGVQNPDCSPEVAVVVKSSKEGNGKSTLSMMMVSIFGSHAKIIDDKEQLIGKHADNEYVLFVAAEEALFAGDPRVADRIKSRLTAPYMPVEIKYRMARQVKNRMKVILTSNHEWAIPAGEEARRWFVVEISNEMIGKQKYFNALNSDISSGGAAQFLDFLLRLNLGNWHPRNVIKTVELGQQQILSAQPIERWLLNCADNGQIPKKIGAGDWWYLELGMDHATADLFLAFCDSQQSGRDKMVSQVAFGVSMTKILGKNHRLTARSDKNASRPMGYFIPDAVTLRNKVFETLGLDSETKTAFTPHEDWTTK